MPPNPHGKPCGVGVKPSTVSNEILEILQNNEGISKSEIRRLMHYKYCTTTMTVHLAELRIAKKVECYINGNTRKPLYRVVR